MKAIAFFTNKGGVGKTTLTCNLGAYLSIFHNKKILIIDADPQANSTQYLFKDEDIDQIYEKRITPTIYDIAKPLAHGKGFATDIKFIRSNEFKIDVVAGDPKLALIEDSLASDWSTGGVRGMRTTFMFRQLLSHCSEYDYVFFDLGPSLGSINRAVLISCDYYVLPMSMDIFSLRATENISSWMSDWTKKLQKSLDFIDDKSDIEINDLEFRLKFIGYTNQQYTSKRDSKGEKRAVKAYDKIMSTISGKIKENIIEKDNNTSGLKLGDIPNLHSLVPMSQISRKPIFQLNSPDGIVGAHFVKVSESKEIFRKIANNLLQALGEDQ